MTSSADVRSIDAIRDFRRELKRYLESMQNILDGLHLESNKALSWIEHDRSRYWPRARKRADEALVVARNSLQRCKMAAMEGERKSCQEEKTELEQAVARLRHCERQMHVVKHWRNRMRHETDDFASRLSRLSHYVEQDLPKAIATLDRILHALEKYTQLMAPQDDQVGRISSRPCVPGEAVDGTTTASPTDATESAEHPPESDSSA